MLPKNFRYKVFKVQSDELIYKQEHSAIEEIYEKLALKHGLSKEHIKTIVISQFRLMKNLLTLYTPTRGLFPDVTIRVFNFGKFSYHKLKLLALFNRNGWFTSFVTNVLNRPIEDISFKDTPSNRHDSKPLFDITKPNITTNE